MSNVAEFEFEGRRIVVKTKGDADGKVTVAAYYVDNDQRVNGYSYSAELPSTIPGSDMRHTGAVVHLIAIARADIENRIWQKYLTTLER